MPAFFLIRFGDCCFASYGMFDPSGVVTVVYAFMLQSFDPSGVRIHVIGWLCYKALTPLGSGFMLSVGCVTKL